METNREQLQAVKYSYFSKLGNLFKIVHRKPYIGEKIDLKIDPSCLHKFCKIAFQNQEL